MNIPLKLMEVPAWVMDLATFWRVLRLNQLTSAAQRAAGLCSGHAGSKLPHDPVAGAAPWEGRAGLQ